VTPHVSFQVTRLGVHLAAAGKQTGKDFLVFFDVSLWRRIFPERNGHICKACRYGFFICFLYYFIVYSNN
jgi:hypothetical protein